MVNSGHALSNSRLHESTERWQHVDGWIDLSVVQVSIDKDLSFCDIACQIGDGMGDIIIGHGQNGQLCNGTILSYDSTGSLIDCGEISIHITWITSSTWHFFSGS